MSVVLGSRRRLVARVSVVRRSQGLLVVRVSVVLGSLLRFRLVVRVSVVLGSRRRLVVRVSVVRRSRSRLLVFVRVPVVRRRRRTALPVDGLHALEGHVDGAVNGGERLGEDAHDREGHVIVVYETHLAEPVRHHDLVAQRVVQLGRHVRAQRHVVQALVRPAPRQRDFLAAAVAVVSIEVPVRADDSESPVAVPQAVGDGPRDRGVIRPLPVGLPRNILRRRTHAEDRIQQQLYRAALGTHDQIGLADGVGEALAHAHAHVLDADQEGDAEGDGAHCERGA